jgi:hypothetical protein
MGGSSGGGSKSTQTNPMIMGALPLVQQQLASGQLAPPQQFNLHPDQLSAQQQYAMALNGGLANQPGFQQANNTAGWFAGGNNVANYNQPNGQYQATMGGSYMGQNGVDGQGSGNFLNQLISGNGMNGPAGGLLTQLINGGGLSGETGQQISQLAQGAGLQGQAGQYLNNVVGGQYLSPDSNPFFNQMVNQSIAAARPSLDAQFASSGRFGSGAASNAMADSADRIGTQLGYQNYQNERQAQQQAAGLLGGYQTGAQNLMAGLQGNAANTMAGMQYGAGNTMAGIDATAFQNERQRQLAAAQGMSTNITNSNQQQLAGAGLLSQLLGQQMTGANNAAEMQNQFDMGNLYDQAQQYNYDQSRPSQGLQKFMQMINGGQMQSTQQQVLSPMQQAGGYLGLLGSVGGLAGGIGNAFGGGYGGGGYGGYVDPGSMDGSVGGSLMSGLGGAGAGAAAGSMFGPIGTGVGALAGGLLGMFG